MPRTRDSLVGLLAPGDLSENCSLHREFTPTSLPGTSVPNLARTLLIAGIYSGGPRGHCHRGHERRRAVLRGRCGVDDTAVTGVAAVTLVTDDTIILQAPTHDTRR